MKVNLGKPAPQGDIPKRGGGVRVATSFNRISERVDLDGNVIDPRTKHIIKKANANSDPVNPQP